MEISEAKKVLEKILKELTVDISSIEVVAGDPHPILSVVTPDSGLLIGVQGENLRALNYIVKKIVEAKKRGLEVNTKTNTFLIDVNGYHKRHIEHIKQQAQTLAERARMYKSEVSMDPVNSYERMIVHAVFSDDEEIFTESSGIGGMRHIVFKYKKKERKDQTSDKYLFAEVENNFD